jgi:geranylgeranyl reductase family protein
MKIVVVGAGPAGSFCAYHLARGGADVTLIDRQAGAWEKPCGGGVPPKVRERFAEVMAYPGPRREVAIGNFVSPKGDAVRLESRAPMWVVARRDFDGYLRELAKEAGAEFWHTAVRRVRREGDRRFVLQGSREREFDFVIGADGAKSIVRRDLLGPLPAELLTMTVGYFLRTEAAEATTWFLEKPGYVWAFPRTDHVCLGGGSSDTGVNMWDRVEELRDKVFPGAEVMTKWAAAIPFVNEPSFFDEPTDSAGMAVIGDAAGHVDALTGEGILYALWGAQLLAEAILEGRPESYGERWRAEYGAELAKSASLSKRFYDPVTIGRVFAVATRSKTLRRFLMDIMTDQPSYLKTGNMLLARLPRIGVELVTSVLSH